MKTTPRRGLLEVLVVLLLISTAGFAQESANEALNECVRMEQVKDTAVGAGAGVLTGLAAMLGMNKKKESVKGAAIGGVVGGAAGFGYAYYTAIDKCYKSNPGLIPESQIQRSKSYDAVKTETHYRPSQGVQVKIRQIRAPRSVRAGSQLDVATTFTVMTPNGAETSVTLQRRLFVLNGGSYKLLPFPGGESEQRTVEPGEHVDTVHIPIPPDAAQGNSYQLQFSAAAAGATASSTLATQFIVTP